MSPPKSCAVCGDKALGYNFNAVTCESCKAFFRRNALAKKQFTCPFSQNCDITVVTRRFCQKCRLKKCLDIGMKSENIMSEEDKLIKRRKIETNRAKRRLNEQKHSAVADSTGFDTTSHDSQSSYDSGKGTGSSTGGAAANTAIIAGAQSCSSPTLGTPVLLEPLADVKPELMTGEEMVEFIVCDPDRASQAISKLMRTSTEALASLEKIISSQKDALRLISHLIAYPGDALKIISKIMNSPFNALTVFTKFMSSPTDALEIISKIVSSPQDVLQFIRNLMDCPEDALDIMNKFMNTPAEALRIINKIFNGSNQQQGPEHVHDLLMNAQQQQQQQAQSLPVEATFQAPPPLPSPPADERDSLIHSMLNHSPDARTTHGGGYHQVLTPETPTTPLTNSPSVIATPSPQAMSIASPATCSSLVSAADMPQYNSPTSLQSEVELPSTSAGLGLAPNSPTSIINDTSDDFDIKTFIQNSFPENASAMDSLNSLESVLTEVIRIEFQAFNNLPPEPRVKMEQMQLQQQQQHSGGYQPMPISSQGQQLSYNVCGTQVQQPICAPSTVAMGRDLNDTEQMKLRELKLASEALYDPVDDDLRVLMGDDRVKPEDPQQDPKLLQVINLTAVAIKRLIKMAKKIGAFRDMCQEDQVALLKGGCTEMMIMRSVMTFDYDRNYWKLPHTKDSAHIRADVLKLAKGNVYEELLKFTSTFDEKWRKDENIVLIMCAIVLFTPTRPRIIHSDVIRLEQNSYYYLLRRYLESVYSGCEAKSAFIKLIQKISDVERLNQFIIGVYLNVDPAQVEPLLREIFDLKNH